MTLDRETRQRLCREPMACPSCAGLTHAEPSAWSNGTMGPTYPCKTCHIVFRMAWSHMVKVEKLRSKRRKAWQVTYA